MITIPIFLTICDTLQGAAALSDSTLSSRMFRESTRLAALRSGADMTLSRLAAGLQYLSDHWPDGVDWPDGVERPAPTITIDTWSARASDPIVFAVSAGDRRIALTRSGRVLPTWIDGRAVLAELGIDLDNLRKRLCA